MSYRAQWCGVKKLSNRQLSQRGFWCFYTATEQHFHLICDLWSITNKRGLPCVNQELIHKTRHTSSPKISIVVGKIWPETLSVFLSLVRNPYFISWGLVWVKIIGIFHYNHGYFHSNECFDKGSVGVDIVSYDPARIQVFQIQGCLQRCYHRCIWRSIPTAFRVCHEQWGKFV